MDKKEFFSVLRESLLGYIPKEEVENNIQFYEDYFKESDLSEKEILEELGDPRLIARTVIEAYKASKGPMADYYTEQARSEYSKEHSSVYEEERKEQIKNALKSRLIFGCMAAVILLGAVFILPAVIKLFCIVLLFIILTRLATGVLRFLRGFEEDE